jgi:hypothetical protein
VYTKDEQPAARTPALACGHWQPPQHWSWGGGDKVVEKGFSRGVLDMDVRVCGRTGRRARSGRFDKRGRLVKWGRLQGAA